MCPQQQCRMLNSLLLTSLGVNSYNPVIDQFFMLIGHLRTRNCVPNFVFLANLTFLVQMRSNVWRRNSIVTLYQDDIEQRFSNELFQFVDYSNEFLDYAEDTIDILHFIYQLTIDKRIKCSFPNVEIAQRTNLIIMVTNCSGKRSFSKLKYVYLIADFVQRKGRNMSGL